MVDRVKQFKELILWVMWLRGPSLPVSEDSLQSDGIPEFLIMKFLIVINCADESSPDIF